MGSKHTGTTVRLVWGLMTKCVLGSLLEHGKQAHGHHTGTHVRELRELKPHRNETQTDGLEVTGRVLWGENARMASKHMQATLQHMLKLFKSRAGCSSGANTEAWQASTQVPH